MSELVKSGRVSLSKRPQMLLHEGKDSLIAGAGICSEMQSAAARLRKL
jgi:hypothetical protein